jgi:hypothetical protein
MNSIRCPPLLAFVLLSVRIVVGSSRYPVEEYQSLSALNNRMLVASASGLTIPGQWARIVIHPRKRLQ